MTCPESIPLTHTLLTEEKCVENIKFWFDRYPEVIEDVTYIENLNLSTSVLPCHTFSYDVLKTIFNYDNNVGKFRKQDAQLVSAKQRLLLSGKDTYENVPHMTEAIINGHDIFLFSYHGVHNPYHRLQDKIPIRPFGIFLKKDIEIFSCVHGSPWDITIKNSFAQEDISNNHLDKYYLFANDLRRLKPIQIQKIKHLNNNFWYYFGNPSDWQSFKGYGNKLFETAGEMRYLERILPEHIAAILWPMWYSDPSTVDDNMDVQQAFKEEFSQIAVVNYTLDKYENFVLSLVEASYYTQKFFLNKARFPVNAEVAKIKVKL